VKLMYGDEKVEKTLTFREVDYETAKEMIVKNHYSKTWASYFGKINVGVFEDDKLLGVAVYGSMMNQASNNAEYKRLNGRMLPKHKQYERQVAAYFLRIEENLNALIGEQFASFNKLMRAIRRAGKL
ncbi:MAG: hypothetical protein GX025_09955, partial [Clostridiales bacterium]|nr:hypothetical protein [Clostridiales bacterium]